MKSGLDMKEAFRDMISKTGTIKAFATDFAKGGDCNPDAMYESSDGKIFIGTTEGLIIYDR